MVAFCTPHAPLRARTVQDLEGKMSTLLHAELTKWNLSLVDTKTSDGKSVKALMTRRGYMDGEKVFDVSALYYDSLGALQRFLAQPGHGGFVHRLPASI